MEKSPFTEVSQEKNIAEEMTQAEEKLSEANSAGLIETLPTLTRVATSVMIAKQIKKKFRVEFVDYEASFSTYIENLILDDFKNKGIKL